MKTENLRKGKQMATFAVIENGTVTNVIVADTKAIAEDVTGLPCFEYDQDSDNAAHIGGTYDEATGIFTAPGAKI